MENNKIELPIDRDAAYKHLWITTITWSLVSCIYLGAGLIFLLWAYLNRSRMRRWCYETKAELTDTALIIHRHSFTWSTTYIPIQQIGHMTISQGLYLRKYKICNIQIGCAIQAGGKMINHFIPAVPEAEAEAVVALLMSRMESRV